MKQTNIKSPILCLIQRKIINYKYHLLSNDVGVGKVVSVLGCGVVVMMMMMVVVVVMVVMLTSGGVKHN